MPGVFRKPVHRGPRSRRRQVVATYIAPPVVSSAVERRPVPPHVRERPDQTEYSRRRRRLAPKRVVAAVVGEECRAKLYGTDRAVFPLLAEVTVGEVRAVFPLYGQTEAAYLDNQRKPFILYGVHCREDV